MMLILETLYKKSQQCRYNIIQSNKLSTSKEYNIAMYSKMTQIPWVAQEGMSVSFIPGTGSFAAYCGLWLHYSIGNFASQPFDCPTELHLSRTISFQPFV